MSAAHTDLVNEIRLYLSSVGGCTIKVATPGLLYTREGIPVRFGTKGVLDIEATLKGRSIWIDAKIGKDRLKPAQLNFVAAKERAGGIAFAAWSVDDVAKRLKAEGLVDG